MKNILNTKNKIISLNKKTFIKKPIKAIKKIKLPNLKKITSFSLNKTFDNFKKKLKQAEIEREKITKKEKIIEAKKIKLELKKQKAEELKLAKKEQLQKIKDEKQKIINREKQKLKIANQYRQIEKQRLKVEEKRL